MPPHKGKPKTLHATAILFFTVQAYLLALVGSYIQKEEKRILQPPLIPVSAQGIGHLSHLSRLTQNHLGSLQIWG
jgi:hypothetical protein